MIEAMRPWTLPSKIASRFLDQIKEYPSVIKAIYVLIGTKDIDEQAFLLNQLFWTSNEKAYNEDNLKRYAPIEEVLNDDEKNALSLWIPDHPIAVSWQYAHGTWRYVANNMSFWKFVEEDIPFVLINEELNNNWEFLRLAYQKNPAAALVLLSQLGENALNEGGIFTELLAFAAEEGVDDEALNQLVEVVCDKVREIWGLDETIPDSWVSQIVVSRTKS